MTNLLSLDHTLFQILNGLAGHSAIADWIYVALAEGVIFLMVAGLVVYIILNRKKQSRLITGLEAALAAIMARMVFVVAIRMLFFRSRPFIAGAVNQLVYHNPAEDSFPSGHASVMFAIAASLFFRKSYKLGTICLVMAIISSTARVIVGVHYPYDIVAGAIIGVISAFMAKGPADFWFKRKDKPLLTPSGLIKE